MNQYNLFLDDERVPYSTSGHLHAFYYTKNLMYIEKEWIVVRNFDEFIAIIEKQGLPEWVSFDHDLGDTAYIEWIDNTSKTGSIDYDNIKEKTGYDCVKWLVDYCIKTSNKFPNYLLHTGNPVGKENMLRYIQSFQSFQNR